MKHIYPIIACFILILFTSSACTPSVAEEKDNVTNNENTMNDNTADTHVRKITVAELKRKKLRSGNYEIAGLVSEINECASPCKSSIPDLQPPIFSICIQSCTTGFTVLESGNPKKKVIIYAENNSGGVKVGKHYLFSVELTSHDSRLHQLFRLQATSYKEIVDGE